MYTTIGKICVIAMVEESLIETLFASIIYIGMNLFVSLFITKCFVSANGDNEKETIKCQNVSHAARLDLHSLKSMLTMDVQYPSIVLVGIFLSYVVQYDCQNIV